MYIYQSWWWPFRRLAGHFEYLEGNPDLIAMRADQSGEYPTSYLTNGQLVGYMTKEGLLCKNIFIGDTTGVSTANRLIQQIVVVILRYQQDISM